MKYIACTCLVMSLFFVCSCQQKQHRDIKLAISDSSLFVSTAIWYPIENLAINEASGLASSKKNKGYFWTHNDSGGKSILYVMDAKGKGYLEFELEEADNRDWEDMAIVGNQQGATVYLGDIGDNFKWHSQKTIYRFQEPTITSSMPVHNVIQKYDKIVFTLPNGIKDTECLMVDPLSKDIYLVSNREAIKQIYRLKYPQSTTQVQEAEYLGDISISQEQPNDSKETRQDLYITSGDISAQGDEILVKNYLNIFYWKRQKGETIAQALKRPAKVIPYEKEPQGEAVTFSADASEYYTISEQAHPSYHVCLVCYKRK